MDVNLILGASLCYIPALAIGHGRQVDDGGCPMNRVTLLVLLALLLPAVCFADTEGNPDARPSVLFSYGTAWGYENSVDETNGQVIDGSKFDLDGSRISAAFRLPVHRDVTAELGYLYDGSEYSPLDIPAHTRVRYHLVSLSLRFYFGK